MTRQPTSSKIQGRFYLLLGAVVVFAAVTVALLAWLSETGGDSNLSDAEAQDLLEGIPQSGATLGEHRTVKGRVLRRKYKTFTVRVYD